MKSFTILFLTSFLFFSCKKEELPEIINSTTPVYSALVTINGDSIEFNAGDDGYVMTTNTSESNLVSFLGGSISNENTSFSIQISNGNLDKIETSNYSGLETAPFYISDDIEVFKFEKSDFENHLRISEINWYVNDIFYSIDDIVLTEPGLYKVCAFVTFTDGSANVLCNDVIVGYKKNAIGELQYIVGLDGKIQAWISSDTEIDNIKWYLNETLTSTENELITIANSSNSTRIKAEITYVNGVKRTKQLLADLNQTGKYIQDFSRHEIEYTRNNDFGFIVNFSLNGESYTTNITENDTSIVTIESIKQGTPNLDGEATFKIHASSECFAKNNVTGEIQPISLDFKIATSNN
ncbi:MAG: hypothetical protein ACPGU5_03405 [Lishizhenia sp.]